ncbi:roadblock/LC7 domain-containing protein [Rhodococcus sp. ZPP]|uniref:roadblock/LC7 domain-containing protein n=1 Tax=Rhodococcus sp. ZPP TaxID=2749906 RepID=UPI001AD85349|nr:roadblock/LC7 domain-containing protein [Rhodococcus sp. ZPP]QTJ64396.1 roadblock/LC7 domain-containing protein [Rhodococcus sp. ZPP]
MKGSTTNEFHETPPLDWLVSNLARDLPRVSHAVLVSADGLLMAASEHLTEDRATQLAAVSSGLASLSAAVSELFEPGGVLQSVVEMHSGYLLLPSVGDGSQLAVLASADCDIRQVGYEMAVLVDYPRPSRPSARERPSPSGTRMPRASAAVAVLHDTAHEWRTCYF